MIGTETKGGISSVIDVYQNHGLFEKFNIKFIPTHRDGNLILKLWIAISAWIKFVCYLIRGSVLLLHVHTASDTSFWRKLAFILPSFVLHVPVIFHLHGGSFPQFYEEESGPLTRKLIHLVFEKSYRVFVLANTWREWVKGSFPEARVTIIYNPVVFSNNPPEKVNDAMTLLFLGRLEKVKGVFDLLEAISLLKVKFPSIKLLLGGDGDFKAVKRRIEELDILNNVEILGWVVGETKNKLIKKTSIYILPSYFEGLPMSVLEAMASGLPIISTPVGGLPDVITNGVEGYLVDPGDIESLVKRIRSLLENPDLQSQMGTASIRKVHSTFSPTIVIPQIEQIYLEIIERASD